MNKNKEIWDKVLSTGEELKYEFSVGENYIKTYIIVWGVISVLLLFLAGLGILTFIIAYVYYKIYLPKAHIYGFSNKRVLIHRGWLSTSMTSVDYNKITDVYVTETFLDKQLTHTGHIAINTAGSNGKEIVLHHVASPYEIKKKLDELRDK
jgi:uncharacterized membrane protein YdbT with pleckstrin-like domain